MLNYVAIVGTTTKGSTNRQLLEFMQRYFVNNVHIDIMDIGGLPMFDKPRDFSLPEQAKQMASQIEAADGVIIATPEYDHAVPAVLMNALEWLSFGIEPFVDKPVMIIGASLGTLGTSRAQAHLRQMLDSPELHARIMPSSEFFVAHSMAAFDDRGQLLDKENTDKLVNLMIEFRAFVTLNDQLRHTVDFDRLVARRVSGKA